MPRVRAEDHLGRRDLLVVAWHNIPELFGLLSSTAQWEVHRFYAPSHTLTDEQVLEHIKQAAAREPSLTQRVGKHYKEIFGVFKFYADQVGKTNWELIGWLVRMEYRRDHADLTLPRSIVVMTIVNSDLDAAKLARIFLDNAASHLKDSTRGT